MICDGRNRIFRGRKTSPYFKSGSVCAIYKIKAKQFISDTNKLNAEVILIFMRVSQVWSKNLNKICIMGKKAKAQRTAPRFFPIV